MAVMLINDVVIMSQNKQNYFYFYYVVSLKNHQIHIIYTSNSERNFSTAKYVLKLTTFSKIFV